MANEIQNQFFNAITAIAGNAAKGPTYDKTVIGTIIKISCLIIGIFHLPFIYMVQKLDKRQPLKISVNSNTNNDILSTYHFNRVLKKKPNYQAL